MIDETLGRIEERLKSADALDSAKKAELLTYVTSLKQEMAALAKTHRDDAHSIAGFAETSVHEATRSDRNPELLRHSLDGMLLSVRSFEVSHPKLTGLINSIGQTLWKIGI